MWHVFLRWGVNDAKSFLLQLNNLDNDFRLTYKPTFAREQPFKKLSLNTHYYSFKQPPEFEACTILTSGISVANLNLPVSHD